MNALNNLRVHRLRSALTLLGVATGVAAVVLLVGLGVGLQESVSRYFANQATQIVVRETTPLGASTIKRLKDSDVRALTETARPSSIADATPVVTGDAVVRYGSASFAGRLAGSRTKYVALARREVIAGTFFDDKHERDAAPVVVLGSDVVDALFAGDAGAAIGKNVLIGRTPFKVVGALRSNRQDDRDLVMPLTATRAYLVGRSDRVDKILVQAVSVEDVPAAVDEINSIMLARHNIRNPEARDFTATAWIERIELFRQELNRLAVNSGMFAALALLIGAVGVTNIMLVSVSERTREIGIRRAVGARRRAILTLFLFESAVLTGIGGILGVALGTVLTLSAGPLIDHVLDREAFWSGTLSIPAMAIAFCVSVLVGTAAGVHPARQAAAQDPIEALRYE